MHDAGSSHLSPPASNRAVLYCTVLELGPRFVARRYRRFGMTNSYNPAAFPVQLDAYTMVIKPLMNRQELFASRTGKASSGGMGV